MKRSNASRRVLRACFTSISLLVTSVACEPITSQRFPVDSNPLGGARLYVNPESHPRRQAEEWRHARPADAALMERMAAQPETQWFGDWNPDVRSAVDAWVSSAAEEDALPVLVAYNIPHRDCGSYSAGGVKDAGAYRQWIRAFADGIRGRRTAVVLEPDALAALDCLTPSQQEERTDLLRDAVEVLARSAAVVYIDAGNARWIGAEEMARRLVRAGVSEADGFALNVSSFHRTEVSIPYGEEISRRVGGKHFVIDTSRNGVGTSSPDHWCNPEGQALGKNPTTRTGHPLVDAFLWIKRPGESDGTCGGGPPAGSWWAEHALELAQRQPANLAMPPPSD